MKKSNEEIKKVKQKIREEIWSKLEKSGVARFPKPIWGRIPNFEGSKEAAEKIKMIDEFVDSNVVFCNPDSPQRYIRYHALMMNKTLIMATPKLKLGFLVLEGSKLTVQQKFRASTIRGAFEYGKTVEEITDKIIDIKITGSVAVTLKGARLGKGGGYSDLEYAILREMGVINENTPIVTSVHELQIVEDIPMTKHDVPVDIILTPERIIKTNNPYPKPKGIYWDEIDKEKLESIPILKKFWRD